MQFKSHAFFKKVDVCTCLLSNTDENKINHQKVQKINLMLRENQLGVDEYYFHFQVQIFYFPHLKNPALLLNNYN
jgi:hypothetical protein